MRILVADDEPHIRELIRMYLSKEGYQVESAVDGQDALDKARRLQPDLIVLDLMMPRVDGFEVTKELREESDVPILMLTVRKEDAIKVKGLELGADDYLTKPFNPKELVARVKAILRRADGLQRSGVDVQMGSLHLHRKRREATLGARTLNLRTKEFDLLFCLAQNAGTALSREQLLGIVWGYTFAGETRTVDVHVNHLRQRLQDSDIRIETLRGVGYKLTAAPSGDA